MRHHHFCFKQLQSPTLYNLNRYLLAQGWRATRFNWRADFSEQNLQFDLAAAEQLEFKHLLAQLVAEYCPTVMPVTYEINDQNWSAVLSEIADQYYRQGQQLQDQVDNLCWILKPALLNNGQNIKIFQQLSQLEQHYLSSNRLGGEHVLQQYLMQPHLLNGCKYSIRMFVVVSNYAGAYLYSQGYFNVALHPYQVQEFTDLSGHLTNEHLREEEANVKQILTSQFDFFPTLYPQIKTIVAATIAGLQQLHPPAFLAAPQRAVAIFGFDFLVDSDQRVWLLEANHGPCFPISDEHPLQHSLYYDFWQAFIAAFVMPIAQRQALEKISYQSFVRVDTDR